MRIGFATGQLQRDINDSRRCVRRYGPERAKKIQLRLQQLVAAANLAEVMQLPQARCHQLRRERDEDFSLDLDGPFRLIVRVANQPIPRKTDGGIDLSEVTDLLVTEVTDTH
ncbi:killer suppression protein [Aeromicrobium ginsengisoli]|uniref:Killer suppression protein n=1 Tax=Aeromicrobium ginsengisoli TaxID=363867 RepID=A0A5M4F9R0_9ACTN|nr:killer suppression protein [Aeromicrobium ginsengisoli]KAA1395115.1 killer suppression protein [Aeromicrobium ginsengisoli]